jgi:hypothetical protein
MRARAQAIKVKLLLNISFIPNRKNVAAVGAVFESSTARDGLGNPGEQRDPSRALAI